MNLFTDKELQDVEKAIKRMPLIKVEARGFVQDSEEITSSSMITVEVKVTFENFTEEEEPGYIHAPHYPFLKRNHIWVMLSD